MVRTLISMRGAILRSKTQGKRKWGSLALAVFVLLLAGSSLYTGVANYAHPAAGADVSATLAFGWLLGWVMGPVVVGDTDGLRMDYFKLLPIPARKLAYALLGAAFANVSLVFSAIAFAGLIAWAAHYSAATVLVACVAVLLQLVLAVVASTASVGLLGPVMSSRRGRDFATFAIAVLITLLSVSSALVPIVASRLTTRSTPWLSDLVRALPSGWGASATDAARTQRWGMVIVPLVGLVLLIGLIVALWPSLLRRRLTMSSAGKSRSRRHRHTQRAGTISWLPDTPLGAVMSKELRLTSRGMLRSLSLLIALMVGLLACIIPVIVGSTVMLPFAGPLFTLIAAATFTNLYGDEGSGLWLTVVVPGIERADVRGRQYAWLLVVAPIGVVLTVALTAISGQTWAWPWVLSGEAAIIGGGAGMIVLVSVLTMYPLAKDGGPTPQRQVKVNLMLPGIGLTAAPSIALLLLGHLSGNDAITWLAFPVGLLTGGLLCWSLGVVAVHKLRADLPGYFARVRNAA